MALLCIERLFGKLRHYSGKEPVPQSAGLRLLAQRQAGGLCYIPGGRGAASGMEDCR
jgi:hypothetical protein